MGNLGFYTDWCTFGCELKMELSAINWQWEWLPQNDNEAAKLDENRRIENKIQLLH